MYPGFPFEQPANPSLAFQNRTQPLLHPRSAHSYCPLSANGFRLSLLTPLPARLPRALFAKGTQTFRVSSFLASLTKTARVTPFLATLTKTTGGGIPFPNFHFQFSTFPTVAQPFLAVQPPRHAQNSQFSNLSFQLLEYRGQNESVQFCS
jgi:hypothetical protein